MCALFEFLEFQLEVLVASPKVFARDDTWTVLLVGARGVLAAAANSPIADPDLVAVAGSAAEVSIGVVSLSRLTSETSLVIRFLNTPGRYFNH